MSSVSLSGQDLASSVSHSGQELATGWFASLFPRRFRTKERILVAKLDLIMLSWAFLSGISKDMDQSATTQAYVSGMKEALNLQGNELVEFTTYFSIGYALCIIPSQLLLTKIRPSFWLPFCEIIWGSLTLATFAAKNAQTIYGLRFALGIFEASSWPGLASMIFHWYTPSEVGKRVAIFGVSGVAGNFFLGILQASLYKNLNGVAGLEGWQWLFIVSGLMTIFIGAIGLVAIPDAPVNTRAIWLSKEEKALSLARMTEVGIKGQDRIPGKVLWRKLKGIATSPITYIFLAGYLQFAWSQRANSYFLLFLKGLTKADGSKLYSTYKVNLIPNGGYALSLVSNIGLNAVADATGWRWQIATLAAAIQLVCTIVLSVWPSSLAVKFTFYYGTYLTAAWGYAFMTWVCLVLRKEPEGRSILIGLAVTLVYVGHATIPLRIWRTSDSPRYPIGFPLAAAWAAGGILVIQSLRIYIQRNQEKLETNPLGDSGQESTTSSIADDDDVEAKGSDSPSSEKLEEDAVRYSASFTDAGRR